MTKNSFAAEVTFKFYTFYCHILRVGTVDNCDSANRQKINACSSKQILGKIWFGFSLNTGKRFFLELSF